MLTELIYFLDVLLDQEGKGRHQAERVQKAELGGVVRSVLDRLELEEVRLDQPRCQTLPLTVYEGT